LERLDHLHYDLQLQTAGSSPLPNTPALSTVQRHGPTVRHAVSLRPITFLLLAGCLLLGHSAAAQGNRPSRSLQDLEHVVRVDSNDATIHLEYGRALLDKHRWDEAERELRQAIAIAPNLAEAYLALAGLPEARGESYWKKKEKEAGRETVMGAWQEAAKFSRLAFLLDPLVDPALLSHVDERVTLRIDGQNQFVWWVYPLSKAFNAFKAGKFAEVKDRCEKLIQQGRSPDGDGLPYDILWLHGLASAHLDDFNVAATDFTVLLTRGTRDQRNAPPGAAPLEVNDFRYLTAMMLFYTGAGDVAAQLLQEALTEDPSLYMAHSRLADLDERGGRLPEAALERQRAVDSNPDNADLLVDLGLTLKRMGKVEDAAKAFEEAERLNPRDPRPSYQRATIAMEQGHTDVARATLTRFLGLAPSRMKADLDDAHRRLEALAR
jgi:tetratricopeptide (TPR) repeat protein